LTILFVTHESARLFVDLPCLFDYGNKSLPEAREMISDARL
jgi:hypothetical protein